MKMATDHKGRLRPMNWGGRADACRGGWRGGATRGPVGELRNGPSLRSSKDKRSSRQLIPALIAATPGIATAEQNLADVAQ
jgi:hypothetical protein